MSHAEAIAILTKLLIFQHFYPSSDEYRAIEKAVQALNRELALGITE